MNGSDRIYNAMSGKATDCVPYMPKIWVKLACEITNTPLIDILNDSYKAMEVIMNAGKLCGVDGVRVFWFPERDIHEDSDHNLIEYSGTKPIGKVDILGGLSTYLFEDGLINIEDAYTVANIQFWKQHSPLVNNLNDAEKICVPKKQLYNELNFNHHIKNIIVNSDEVAVVGNCGSATLSFYSYFRGSASSLMDFYDNPTLVNKVMDKGIEIALEKGKFCIDNGLKILRLNDSTANMNVISPAIFRDFIKPRFKTLCDELHKYNSDVRIYCHVCGNILPIIEDLAETGLDCIAPLDPLGEFSCADARSKVPADFTLMGGIDTLSFINKTEKSLKEEALECINGAGRSGSFILGSGCVLPPKSKLSNILAASETAHSYLY